MIRQQVVLIWQDERLGTHGATACLAAAAAVTAAALLQPVRATLLLWVHPLMRVLLLLPVVCSPWALGSCLAAAVPVHGTLKLRVPATMYAGVVRQLLLELLRTLLSWLAGLGAEQR